MDKLIDILKNDRPSSQVTELKLDDCFSRRIVGITEEFTSLQTLSMIGVGLLTLTGLPPLPQLKNLMLEFNRISSGLDYMVKCVPKLTYLTLSLNRFSYFRDLKPLKFLKDLKTLSLKENNVTKSTHYRKRVLSLIPSLEVLDELETDAKDERKDSDDDDEKECKCKHDAGKKQSAENGLQKDLKERYRLKREMHVVSKKLSLCISKASKRTYDDREMESDDEQVNYIKKKVHATSRQFSGLNSIQVESRTAAAMLKFVTIAAEFKEFIEYDPANAFFSSRKEYCMERNAKAINIFYDKIGEIITQIRSYDEFQIELVALFDPLEKLAKFAYKLNEDNHAKWKEWNESDQRKLNSLQVDDRDDLFEKFDKMIAGVMEGGGLPSEQYTIESAKMFKEDCPECRKRRNTIYSNMHLSNEVAIDIT